MARVLIIDDNVLIRTLLREILTDGGHDVVGQASDGVKATAALHTFRPDVVTLDLVMPGRTGAMTLHHVLMLAPSLAVIVCSAALTPATRQDAKRLGARGFIEKPFDRHCVLDAVQQALAEHTPRGAVLLPAPASDALFEWGADRRDFARVAVRLPILVIADDGGAPLDTRTVDVSGGGVLLEGDGLKLGAAVRFSLGLDPREVPVDGRARVARLTNDGQLALAFERVSIADHERLIHYLQDRHLAAAATRR